MADLAQAGDGDELVLKGLERAAEYARFSRAESTRRNYERCWARFRDWCASAGVQALPADPRSVAAYVAHQADSGRSPGTISVALAAIRDAHSLNGHANPCDHPGVRETIRGVRRKVGVAPRRQKAPLSAEELREMVKAAPRNLKGIRDTALLLLGWAGALRRSELVSVDVEDLSFVKRGLELKLRRAKGDQEGRGAVVRVPYAEDAPCCPVRALRHWLEAARITEGPVFRRVDCHSNVGERLQGRAVALVVKRYAARIGREDRDFAGHSLRSGFATSAGEARVDLVRLRDHLRHSSIETTSVYVRPREAWESHPGAGLL